VQEQERFARLESTVEHVQSDLAELKTDVRALSAKFDAIKDSLSEAQASRGLDKVWWMSIAGGLLAVMARGFKWL
jgi:phage shock protein A